MKILFILIIVIIVIIVKIQIALIIVIIVIIVIIAINVRTFFQNVQRRVFATNSDFRILISLGPNVVDLKYFNQVTKI